MRLLNKIFPLWKIPNNKYKINKYKKNNMKDKYKIICHFLQKLMLYKTQKINNKYKII